MIRAVGIGGDRRRAWREAKGADGPARRLRAPQTCQPSKAIGIKHPVVIVKLALSKIAFHNAPAKKHGGKNNQPLMHHCFAQPVPETYRSLKSIASIMVIVAPGFRDFSSLETDSSHQTLLIKYKCVGVTLERCRG